MYNESKINGCKKQKKKQLNVQEMRCLCVLIYTKTYN